MSDLDDGEETEIEAADREAKAALNTPADDRVLAMRALRNLVGNPNAKPSDRTIAAVQLLKAVNENTSDDPAQLQGYDLTDDQLLAVIRDAQAVREVPRGTEVAPKVELLPQTPSSSPLVAISALEEALAGVPDIDPLCL